MYFYHGYALGVGSTSKDNKFPAAACALPCTGGKATATSKNFNAQGVTFDSAVSTLSGTEQERNGVYVWTTQASVVIENLKLTVNVKKTSKELMSIGHLEAHVVSEYRAGDLEANTSITEGKIKSHFAGLKVLGNPVDLELADDVFERYLTFGSMEDDFTNKATHDRLMDCLVGHDLNTLPPSSPGNLRAVYDGYQEQNTLPKLTSAVLCSLVKKATVTGGGIQTWGPIIRVDGIGTIYLGEVIVWPWMRCLTMFRVELDGGTRISGGSAGANGTTWPPGAYGGGDGWP